MVEAQDLDLRACAPNAQGCDTRGTEKLQRLVLVVRKIRQNCVESESGDSSLSIEMLRLLSARALDH